MKPLGLEEAPNLFPHGGPRRRQGEGSDTLSERQCRAILVAADKADQSGYPFNRFITILWERGGIEERAASVQTGHFIRLASDWIRLRGERLRWIYVHEWGMKNGAHVHIMLHVPKRLDRDFAPMPLRWVKQLLPCKYTADVLDSKKFRGANAPDNVSRQIYEHALMERLHYVLKAADPALESELGLEGWGRERWGQSSRVYGKRAGWWQDRS